MSKRLTKSQSVQELAIILIDSCPLALRSVSLPNSIQEEAEFDGDPTLELISEEKAQEMERPAWAKKIMSCVQPKGMNSPYLFSDVPFYNNVVV